MFKLLTVLASLAASHLVPEPEALEGSWDASSDGQHVAEVHVQGDRANFNDGSGEGEPYEYKIHLKNGLFEMNGWIAHAGSKPANVLWHKGREQIMWRRNFPKAARKLRGGKTLEQSRSDVSRTTLPTETATSFSDLLAESEAAREHTASFHAKHTHGEEDPVNATVPEEPGNATVAAEEPVQAEPTAQQFTKVVRKSKFKAQQHALSQYLTAKYITGIKVAQSIELNETKTLEKSEREKGLKVHKPHQRRKVYPAAMQSLAALMTNTQKGVDENAFDDVIETVRQIIRDEAATTTTDIEATEQGLVDDMSACATEYAYSSGAAAGRSSAYDFADSDYVAAVGEYDTAYAAENMTCTEKNTICDNRDAKGLELYNEVTGSSDCELPGEADDTVTYDDNFVLASVDSWANTLITKHTAWDTAKVSCTEKEQECSAAETVTAEKETAKVGKCTVLESAASDGLGAYDGCWNTAEGAYQGSDPTTTIDSMKNSIEAVETLMCFIDTAMEGLAKPKKDRTKMEDGDATLSCEMDDSTSMYECTCSNGPSSRYMEAYNLGYNAPGPPDRDEGWDDLGCPEVESGSTTPGP